MCAIESLNEKKHGVQTPRKFFFKSQTFGLGQTYWAENFLRHLGYFEPSHQHYFGTVSPLSMGKCTWMFFLQKLWFSGLKHKIPK